ncbi:MAG: response regulator transcription factor [Clostridiales bacterium]|nr:response regulator transcription factor [Clostridiales bacterium]MCD7828529.1 response regulator transcription factor [Clostridiales bacterium]
MQVLIVEDEVSLADAITAILKKEQYFVDAVYDGRDGLDYALSGIYDLILLDIMLPKMNGLDVLKELRANGIQTPVMLLTARTEVNDKIKGLDCGADDYLTKPFNKGELLARVRALTRRKGEIPSNELEFGDIILNQSTYELICGGKSVKLGAKEFKIMQMLMYAPKNIISKDEFIEKIWGYDSEAEYNSIEVYISFLRKKLGAIKSEVQIKASRGIGYYLEDHKL